jgi:hypothetical protein
MDRAAAILSRVRSTTISRSNWAKDSIMLSVSRPMDVVVFNCCVTETKAHPTFIKFTRQAREVQ